MAQWDFSTGNTNPETFPAQAFAAAAAEAIEDSFADLNRYPGKLGHEGLRKLMVEREAEREGVTLDYERMMITNGSMQAVTLVAEALCTAPDSAVIMEEYSYVGTINAYRALGIKMVGVPLDGYGMRMDALADTLETMHAQGRPPSFIYTLPTYQNPTGHVMPRERRLELLALAKRYECVVVEDNCYADVHFEGEKEPALYALDDGPRQIYICSLSKIFAPGVRLGYLCAREPMFERLLERRHDAGPNTLAAAMTERYLRGRIWQHTEMANAALKVKRDAMLDALERELGNTCSWSHPPGGLFVWVRLPDDVSVAHLKQVAVQHDVDFADGATFHIHNEPGSYIRLAFGFPSVEEIRDGIARLAAALKDARDSQ